MDIKHEEWMQDIEREHGELKWVANVDKDDEITRAAGHIVGPPKASDQYTAEEFDERGVVGIYVRVLKGRKKTKE
jgi:hypothetical protein